MNRDSGERCRKSKGAGQAWASNHRGAMSSKPSSQARPGNANAMHHGARSQAEVGRVAGYRKQSLLMRLGLVQRDLPPVDHYLLDQWAHTAAEVLLMERWTKEHGLIDEAGKLPAFSATFYAARNSASRQMAKLEPRLIAAAKAKQDGGGLDRYLETTYGEKRQGGKT